MRVRTTVLVFVCIERDAMTKWCQSTITTMADRIGNQRKPLGRRSTMTENSSDSQHLSPDFLFSLPIFLFFFLFISAFFSAGKTATITVTVINFVVFSVRCNKLFYTTQTRHSHKGTERRKRREEKKKKDSERKLDSWKRQPGKWATKTKM